MSSMIARAGNPSACHLLLVEGTSGHARLTRELLAQVDAQRLVLSRAATLSAAIELLSRGEAVDAVIVDLNLPDSQGVETVRRVRIVTREAPIIAISRQADNELRRRAQVEGAEDLFSIDEPSSQVIWAGPAKACCRSAPNRSRARNLRSAPASRRNTMLTVLCCVTSKRSPPRPARGLLLAGN